MSFLGVGFNVLYTLGYYNVKCYKTSQEYSVEKHFSLNTPNTNVENKALWKKMAESLALDSGVIPILSLSRQIK